MSKKQLITPQSLVIEKTALELACVFWEAGKSSGMKSKYKSARAFAKARVETFIPKAVELLMDMLGKDSTPADQKQLIYDAFLERANDPDLSNCGIPVFAQPVPYKSDKHVPAAPLIINTMDSDISNLLSSTSKVTFNG
jgi:hypothetical protein